MSRRILFVIRGKLGDSLVAYATVRAYADAFPQDAVTLLTRANYAALLAREAGVRVLGFASRLGLLAQLARLRLCEPAFDALLVLWAFGSPVRWIGRWTRARRKVYLDDRHADIYPEHAEVPREALQWEPMWRVARVFEPGLPPLERLHVPSLAALRRADARAVGIAPLADEARRIMGPATLAQLVRGVQARHPGAPVRVFVNPADRGAQALLDAGLPAGAEFRFFPQLADLLREFAELACWYGTDTGLYHVAAAMGIPATVFYGPTRSHTNMFPAQPGTCGMRLAVLGGAHCEEKTCTQPWCIAAAVAAFAGEPAPGTLSATPAACPLRAHPPATLDTLAVYEGSRRKA
ncbi:MAG: glycosyltransferase family 9 protein [Betaproteobacteria bacterium]|nr:glycosyltransferase family 9 protein [Betaproteobacteria bacterium]